MKNKFFLKLFSAFIFILSCTTLNAYAMQDNNVFNYTIRSGDTFFKLSLRFNTTVTAIQSMNPGVEATNLIIDSKIKIAAGNGIMLHTVKKGDTLFRIAHKHNSTVQILSRRNFISNPNIINIGDVLAVPENSAREKKIVWLDGWVWDGLYDDTYSIYLRYNENTLDDMIGKLENRLFKITTKDENGKTIPKYSSWYYIGDYGLGGVSLETWGFTQRMGIGWDYHPTTLASFNTEGRGQSNNVPVDAVKISKALYVAILMSYLDQD